MRFFVVALWFSAAGCQNTDTGAGGAPINGPRPDAPTVPADARPDGPPAAPPDAPPPPKGFACEACAPSAQGSGSGCIETVGLIVTCTGNYTFPSGNQRVTLVDSNGSDTTTLTTVACGTVYQQYTLAAGSSSTCSDANLVHVTEIDSTDDPPFDVTCTYNASSCGSGSGS